MKVSFAAALADMEEFGAVGFVISYMLSIDSKLKIISGISGYAYTVFVKTAQFMGSKTKALNPSFSYFHV